MQQWTIRAGTVYVPAPRNKDGAVQLIFGVDPHDTTKQTLHITVPGGNSLVCSFDRAGEMTASKWIEPGAEADEKAKDEARDSDMSSENPDRGEPSASAAPPRNDKVNRAADFGTDTETVRARPPRDR